MSNAKFIRADQRYILPTFSRFPGVITRGKGSWVWDADGKRYLDFLTGITVNSLGHAHPGILRAAKAQLGAITHVGNLFYSRPQAELAELLVKLSFARRVAFANTGAEANELLIKLARKWGGPRGRHEIITFGGGFHGRTYGALTATAQPKMHLGLGPMLPGFRYAQYNDLASVEKLVGKKTAAILVEPIQGEGGVNTAQEGFLTGLRRLCDRHGLLLMVDEIQTGLGRTGTLFRYQAFGRRFIPDVMSLGKALGAGLPLSAVLVGPKAEKLMGKGDHGTTMGGNAVACAAGLVLLKEVAKPSFLRHVNAMGERLKAGLSALAVESGLITELRGAGLMRGAQLTLPSPDVAARAFKKGLIVNATAGTVLRLHPPLNVKAAEIDHALAVLRDVFKDLRKNGGK